MICELEQYAHDNNIPIMHKDSINFIIKLIRKFKVKEVLEIGTAIGYSSICMARVDKNIKVTTIEKDRSRYLEAVKNIKSFGLQHNIDIIFNDALKINIHNKFDLILIDAAKTKNIEFFNKFRESLNKNGLIIIDNINFHGYVGKSETIQSNNLKKIVIKIEKSIEFLKNQKDFNVKFIDIGDGLAICHKKEK